MKWRKIWILTSMIVCCAALLSVKVSGTRFLEKEQLEKYGSSTLHGLKLIYPSVYLNMLGESEQDKLGLLTRDNLQRQVELALRTAGVEVPTHPLDRSAQSDLNIAVLIVNVEVSRMNVVKDVPLHAYKVSTGLYQTVELVRDRKIRTEARTWPFVPFAPEGGVGLAGSRRVEQEIKDEVTRQMNEFINDYLAANPKEQPTKPAGKLLKDK